MFCVWAHMWQGCTVLGFFILCRSTCSLKLTFVDPLFVNDLVFLVLQSLRVTWSQFCASCCKLPAPLWYIYPLWSTVLFSVQYGDKDTTSFVFSSSCVPHQNSSWQSAQLSWPLCWVSQCKLFKTGICYYSSLKSLGSETLACRPHGCLIL